MVIKIKTKNAPDPGIGGAGGPRAPIKKKPCMQPKPLN